MGQKQSNSNGLGDSLSEALKLFFKAILKVALFIIITIAKIIHAIIGKLIEFIENRVG